MAGRPEIGFYYRNRMQERMRKRGIDASQQKIVGYAARNRILLEIGFSNYTEYLQSDLWTRIRTSAFMLFGKKCKLCENNAEQIHHRSYSKKVLLGEDMEMLMPVCKSCHDKIEFKSDGSKRSGKKSQITCDELLKQQKRREKAIQKEERRKNGEKPLQQVQQGQNGSGIYNGKRISKVFAAVGFGIQVLPIRERNSVEEVLVTIGKEISIELKIKEGYTVRYTQNKKRNWVRSVQEIPKQE